MYLQLNQEKELEESMSWFKQNSHINNLSLRKEILSFLLENDKFSECRPSECGITGMRALLSKIW